MLVSLRANRSRPQPHVTRAAALTGGARVDVCIAGTGLAELLAAYLLSREGRSVMLLQEGPLGHPAAAELAQLSGMIEQPYLELEQQYGVSSARLAAQSYAAAVDALEAIVHRERISCEFERLDGYLFCSRAEGALAAQREVDAAHRAGATSVELCAAAPIEGSESGPCVRYPGQIQFHPGKLADGLARAIAREGGRIHAGVPIRAIEAGKPCSVLTSAGHRIESGHVVTPGAGRSSVRTANVIAMRVPRGAMNRALYWSTGDYPRCARLRTSGTVGELLLVAGNSPPDGLAEWARNHFPRVGDVFQRFEGEMPAASDLFALAGIGDCDTESLYVSTASWGTAVTRAVVAGMAIRDFVVGARAPEPGCIPQHELS